MYRPGAIRLTRGAGETHPLYASSIGPIQKSRLPVARVAFQGVFMAVSRRTPSRPARLPDRWGRRDRWGRKNSRAVWGS